MFCHGATHDSSTSALMEKLRLKYQQRPWTETLKLVHFCMDKPRQPDSSAPDGPLLSCMEKIQRVINAKPLFSVMNTLESLSKQKGLSAHVSPSGTTCYITSNMFYVEVQLEMDGRVVDVKLAHLGDAPVVCDEMAQHLRMKNYDAFGKILEELSNMYQIPGDSEMKAKGYHALQALEKDLYSMSLLHRSEDVNRVMEVLHGKVGHLVPRAGGTPMNIEFYISPYQILEEELNPGSQGCGTKTVVTVEGTDTLHKLSLSPLLADSQGGEDGNPVFLPLTDELSMDLPAFFVLKFHQPIPMSLSSIEMIQRLTGIQITGLKRAPLYELIVQSTLKEKGSEDVSTYKSHFFVSLPDCPKHCYFINNGSEKSDSAGALVSKIPFSHPQCVPGVIESLRHQVAFNSLISSCVSDKHINEDGTELLYFEVAPHKNTSFSVFFLHPMNENLASVTIDVITSREIQCHLHLNPQDPTLNSSDDFITRAVKRCMSVPVAMRAIFRNAAKVKAASEIQDVKADMKQKPEPPCEQVTHSDSPEDSLSVAGQQHLVVTDKPSITDSAKENPSTAKSETLGDNTEKSNPTQHRWLSGISGPAEPSRAQPRRFPRDTTGWILAACRPVPRAPTEAHPNRPRSLTNPGRAHRTPPRPPPGPDTPFHGRHSAPHKRPPCGSLLSPSPHLPLASLLPAASSAPAASTTPRAAPSPQPPRHASPPLAGGRHLD